MNAQELQEAQNKLNELRAKLEEENRQKYADSLKNFQWLNKAKWRFEKDWGAYGRTEYSLYTYDSIEELDNTLLSSISGMVLLGDDANYQENLRVNKVGSLLNNGNSYRISTCNHRLFCDFIVQYRPPLSQDMDKELEVYSAIISLKD